jgi:hypothetical protein
MMNERTLPMDATHSNICKFGDANNERFTPLLAQIKYAFNLALTASGKSTGDTLSSPLSIRLFSLVLLTPANKY